MASAPRRTRPAFGSIDSHERRGHHYLIEAWGNSIRSPSLVELSLGVDLAGGKDWQAPSVVWHPGNEIGEDEGVRTRIAIRAAALTVFIRGHRPFALQGGTTLFDLVHMLDLGP